MSCVAYVYLFVSGQAMQWSKETRERAAELFEQGYGYKAVSSQLGVNQETVRDWSYTWRALGKEQLCKCTGKREYYPPEIKLAVALDRAQGVAVIDVMQRYKIPNRTRIKEWCSLYRKEGEAAFLPRDS